MAPKISEIEGVQLCLFEASLEVDMAQLKAYRETLTRSRQARNTLIGYASDWRDFELWCKIAGRGPLPASVETVELYVTHRLQVEHLKVTTMERRVSAIRDAHRRAEMPMPGTAGVRAILNGARHLRKESPEGKEPITPAQLRRISTKLTRRGGARDIRDVAIMVIGFASALRRSNLAALDLRDVRIERKGLVVEVRSSKTDQVGKGVTLGLHRGKWAGTCPVRVLREWLKLRPKGAGPLFTQVTSGGNPTTMRMSGAAIAEVVQRAVEMIGLDKKQFGGHSLRASCATAAHAEGAQDTVIMRRTGHRRVETLQAYLRDADPFGPNPLAQSL